jgi:hypothetical protein
VKALGLTILCAVTCAVGAEHSPKGTEVIGDDRPQNLSQLLGSADNLAVLRDASTTRVCSVKSSSAGRKTPDRVPDVFRAADRGEFILLNAGQAATLKKLLLDERAYAWERLPSFCLPHYTIRAEFKSGGKIIAANFCFGCGNILFAKAGKSLGDRDLTASAAGELFRFFQQVFPDDPILIQLARKPPTPGQED